MLLYGRFWATGGLSIVLRGNFCLLLLQQNRRKSSYSCVCFVSPYRHYPPMGHNVYLWGITHGFWSSLVLRRSGSLGHPQSGSRRG